MRPADGLVLAYRIGARLRELDSFQYHPTGVAYPPHLAGGLISEAARSSGAKLINGVGERFVDELQPRDVVAAAILRECAEGRGIQRDGQVGVFLDTPTLEKEQSPGSSRSASRRSAISRRKCGLDPASGAVPRLSDPALPERRGRDRQGRRDQRPGLFCVGELSGGIHGRNRMMGNSLLDIFSFGRRAGAKAAPAGRSRNQQRAGIGHIYEWQRQLTQAGLPLHVKGPQLFPRLCATSIFAPMRIFARAGSRAASTRGRAHRG